MSNRNILSPPKNPFHGRLKSAGISQVAASYQIKIPFQTLTKYLCAYMPMPQDVERKLELLLAKHVAGSAGAK
jgi:hypothetical protein